MGNEETVRVPGGAEVTVRELTVGEVRAWLLAAEKRSEAVDFVGELLFEDCPLSALARMTDLPIESMDDYSPSALRDLVRKARELNAHFFGLLGRLKTVNDKLAELLELPHLSDPAPPSSGPGTPGSGTTPGASTSPP